MYFSFSVASILTIPVAVLLDWWLKDFILSWQALVGVGTILAGFVGLVASEIWETRKKAKQSGEESEEKETLIKESPKISKEPSKISKEPSKISKEPSKISKEPSKISKEPSKISKEPFKLSKASIKVNFKNMRVAAINNLTWNNIKSVLLDHIV